MTVGGVDYAYGIGRLEVTVGQWVKFLSVDLPHAGNPGADPEQKNLAFEGYERSDREEAQFQRLKRKLAAVEKRA